MFVRQLGFSSLGRVGIRDELVKNVGVTLMTTNMSTYWIFTKEIY